MTGVPTGLKRRTVALLAAAGLVCQLVAGPWGLAVAGPVAPGSVTVPICTANGIVRIALDADGTPAAPRKSGGAPVCPICLAFCHAGSAPLGPVPEVPIAAAPAFTSAPPAPLPAPGRHGASLRLGPSPRGPPVAAAPHIR